MEQPMQPGDITYRWDKTEAVARAAAAFAGTVIGSDTRYISHSEMQTGLSPDGKVWAENLSELYRDNLLGLGDDRDLLVAVDPAGTIVGLLLLGWEESARRRFAVLEDVAVDPSMRSLGIGERLLASAEARVAERGIDWLFLESGLHNHGAHRFFERHGFATVSHVFTKRLAGTA